MTKVIGRAFFYIFLNLLNLQQFDVKDEGCVRRDSAVASSLSAIRKISGDDEATFASHFHASDALVPALDDLTGTKREAERLAMRRR